MTDQLNPVIDETIAYIQKNINEPLTLSQLAKHVSYSPYHFTRIFKERIGLPPLYYVSSLRLQKAKELLLYTNLTVRDIGLEIGQQSLGTFSTRFTEHIGVTPSNFRNSVLLADSHLHSLQQLNNWTDMSQVGSHHAKLTGTIRTEIPFNGVILIGLFAKPIPEGLPLHGTLRSSIGDFCFTGVKPGTYYLMATSIPWGMQAIDMLLPATTLRTRSKMPITVERNLAIPHQDVMLHEPREDDSPILISLPLLMNNFLKRTSNRATHKSEFE